MNKKALYTRINTLRKMITKKSVLLFTFSVFCISTFAQTNRSKSDVINYLNDAIKNRKVIVGQHCENGKLTSYGFNRFVQALKDSTGKYPALIGLEYGYTVGNDLNAINTFAIGQWKRGGLVAISWHADNPFDDGKYNCRMNSIKYKNIIDLNALLSNAPNSAAKISYRQELTKVALALKQLQDNGVVVLWRPFHEMNGNWFWWGTDGGRRATNTEAYKNLWKDMYNTFVNEYGLKNLIWVYTPNKQNKYTSTLQATYPGAQYVDVVGIDMYTPRPVFPDYEDLKAFNKPIVVGEVGPTAAGYGTFDEMDLIDLLRGKAAYFLQWNGWDQAKIGIRDNPNFKKMMNQPYSITLQ